MLLDELVIFSSSRYVLAFCKWLDEVVPLYPTITMRLIIISLTENGIMISVRMEYEFYLGQMFSEGF